MSVLTNYKPKEVLAYFEEICSIPHGSGNVGKISDYLVQFAKERNLRYRQDEAKNVIIWKEGTEGYETSAPVIIQGHMDMVAVKEDSCPKDLTTEGLDLEVLEIDGEHWISAKGTSLGGDDGIAVAYGLALLDSDSIPHPPLELVVTTEEEVGMEGAAALDASDLKGRIFMNIDSEDEGIFTVGCAGGLRAQASVPYETEEKEGTVLQVKLSGFLGGHSGVEIDKGRLNANLVMGRVLNAVRSRIDMRLVEISGGDKDNAIAVFSEASVLVDPEDAAEAETIMKETVAVINEEYASVEKGVQLSVTSVPEAAVSCFTKASTDKTVILLLNYIDGIRRMNPDMEHMVQTSLNLGIVSTEENAVVFTSALRSSSETEKAYLLDQVRGLVELAGGSVEVFGNYPGWEYRPESLLRDTMVEVYREQYGSEPVVMGIHAGLECGLFLSKLPDLDCLSYGPQMHNIHTTEERLSIESTARTWELTKRTLERLR
ncbi:MAG: aminoacyl-histidine dipeptidase [Lachnospiraceae bacterium]|nr:aminoacyl-histidine dipeptidase [Lachnospiraceae bacterium]